MVTAVARTNPAVFAPVRGLLSRETPVNLCFVIVSVLEILRVVSHLDFSGRMAIAGVGMDEVSSLINFFSKDQFFVAAVVARGIPAISMDGTTLDGSLSLS